MPENEGKYRVPCKKCERMFVSMVYGAPLCLDCSDTTSNKYTHMFKRIKRDLIQDSECYICKKSYLKATLHVHHINRNKRDDSRENLAILCQQCHGSLHRLYKTPTPIYESAPASIYYGKFGARWEPNDTITPTEISNQLISLLLFNKV